MPGTPSESSARILIIEDDPDVVAATRSLLERRGYRVTAATDAPEGRRRVEEDRPHLILLDVMLPRGTEGFHFVWSLRNHPDPVLRETPVVVMSAIHRTTDLRLYPEIADQEYAPGEFLPVQAFLDKPFVVSELVRVVERVLAGQRHR
jgi:CheY-like chemotaxis protein